MDIDLLAQMAVESLVEDESLRGDLTDWEYQPLLDWAIAGLMRCVEEAANTEDPRTYMDARVAALRQTLRAAVQAVDERDASLLVQVLSPPAVDAADVEVIRRRLAGLPLTEDKEMNARQIVEALSARPKTQ